jgi:hypothetical protein
MVKHYQNTFEFFLKGGPSSDPIHIQNQLKEMIDLKATVDDGFKDITKIECFDLGRSMIFLNFVAFHQVEDIKNYSQYLVDKFLDIEKLKEIFGCNFSINVICREVKLVNEKRFNF